MVWYMSWLIYGVSGIVVAGMTLLVCFQERLVYVPVLPGLTKSYPFTPARLRLIFQDVWLTSSDGLRLHSWLIKFSPDSTDIAHRLEMVCIMLQKLHCNVFMLSYRGYGASDGYPSQQGIIRDAQAALDHLSQRTDIDTSQIVVFGRSLGGAVGAVVTKNNPDKVKQPILFLSGLRDEMVPSFHMEMLYAKAAAHNKRCTFVDFPTGMHMDTWIAGGDHYWKTVRTFLQKNVLEKGNESQHNGNGISLVNLKCIVRNNNFLSGHPMKILHFCKNLETSGDKKKRVGHQTTCRHITILS